MKDMSLKYIVRETNLSLPEKLMLADFGGKDPEQPANLKLEAFAIYTLVLMAMADNKESGFFIEIGAKELRLLASEVLYNSNVDFVKEVIDSCLQNGLFDKEYYDKFKILTSKDIQEKYFYSRTVKRRAKESIEGYKQYVFNAIWKELKAFDTVEKDGSIFNEDGSKNDKVGSKNVKVGSKNVKNGSNFEQTKLNKTKQDKTKLNETERETKVSVCDESGCEGQAGRLPTKKQIFLTETEKESLSQFIKRFPNKDCELNFEIPKGVDFDLLTKKVEESSFLRELGNLDAKWCVMHFDEIVKGKYSDFDKPLNSKEEPISGRYEGMNLNDLYDDLSTIEI